LDAAAHGVRIVRTSAKARPKQIMSRARLKRKFLIASMVIDAGGTSGN
jgi:hypothetical protein